MLGGCRDASMYTAVRMVKMYACRNADEHLEGGDEQQHEERQDRHRLEEDLVRLGEQHRVRQEGERDEQHVTGEHVGEESDGQGEGPHEDVAR